MTPSQLTVSFCFVQSALFESEKDELVRKLVVVEKVYVCIDVLRLLRPKHSHRLTVELHLQEK